MNKRTFNIIMACKGNFDKLLNCSVKSNSEELSPYERVIEYMSVECDSPKSSYTATNMHDIMLTAMCDYLNTCDNPGYFIRTLDEIVNKERYSMAEQIAIALELVAVKDGGKYINGFDAYFSDTTIKNENDRKKLVSDFIKNTAQKLNQYKDYEVGYGTPKNGKMIVNYNGVNYLIDVQALDKRSIEEDMKLYDYMFKDRG